MNIENMIFSNLLHNEDYGRKTIPFLRKDYFEQSGQVVFQLIEDYVNKYNAFPTKDVLQIELKNATGIGEEQYKECSILVDTIPKPDVNTRMEWAIDETEKFCQNKAIYNAILESIKIMDDTSGKYSRGVIPQLLTDALGVSFDASVGHDFLEDDESRYEFYHRKEERLPFDIELLNLITGGGLPRKTLNILLAGTGVGKTLAMCHMASANLMMGKNVLYITMEMAEEKIAERIDANLLNIPLKDMKNLTLDDYTKRIKRVKEKTVGKLIIKEYPTSTVGAANFRHLLNELKIKKNFVPDVIYIDYLNICMSSRLKNAANVNSYTYVKAIAEELRGLAVEYNLPIVSATQTTRGGYDNSDVGLTDTSESFGLPATADFMIALISNEELEKLSQIMIKQLKNRYGDPSYYKRFVVGVDKSRMKLYNTDDSAQDDIVNDSPVFDKTPSGEYFDSKTGEIFDKDKFKGFK